MPACGDSSMDTRACLVDARTRVVPARVLRSGAGRLRGLDGLDGGIGLVD